ncbi:MAG TPA: ferric reductase-like transmembrane domain-containing protein [Verrucomicrobiae bacterium]|nr:ferric reductase-like transmembrane domain-containing protein [Verrucomicrobiae bacterium]
MTTTDLWYASRGSGLVLLAVLTSTIGLGALARSGWRPGGWPRFVIQDLHRTLALFALAVGVLHIVTAELDPFVRLGWLAVVLPFSSSYRPLWMGAGAIALELLLAVVATSLVRQRLGHAAWRSVHQLVLLAWPLTLAHVVGMGPDVAIPAVAAGVAGCGILGLIALALRVDEPPRPGAARLGVGGGAR